jgi:hypothetical protein
VCGKQFNRNYAEGKFPLTSILSPKGRGRREKVHLHEKKKERKNKKIQKFKARKPALLKGFRRWRADLKRWLLKPLIHKGFRVSCRASGKKREGL